MFVKNVENLSYIGRINPIEGNIARFNAETKPILKQWLEKITAVTSLKTAFVAEKSSAILNPQTLIESVVRIRADINCIVRKYLGRITQCGLEAQRDIGVAIGK